MDLTDGIVGIEGNEYYLNEIVIKATNNSMLSYVKIKRSKHKIENCTIPFKMK